MRPGTRCIRRSACPSCSAAWRTSDADCALCSTGPRVRFAAMQVVERCAAWAVGFRGQPIPPQVMHHARRALIDWHAALYPGAVLAPATLLEKALAGDFDRGEARLALGRKATARAAALINATAAHTAEVDDIFRDGIYHPGAPTIAAALALASSKNLLRSIVVGYEISTRVGAAMGRAHY